MNDTLEPPKSCPICRKPVAARFQPFCSARCKDVDLNRWFKGAYAIPGEEAPDEAELARAGRREPEADQ